MDELAYLQLIKRILDEGSLRETRNGLTHSIFGHHMEFSLKDQIIPILTTKRVAWKTCFRELMWFVRGSTNNNQLEKVHIWDANASREFLDSRGLNHLKKRLGPVYGHQWRHFNAPYIDCHTDYTGQGVDQLQYIINCLKIPNHIHPQNGNECMESMSTRSYGFTPMSLTMSILCAEYDICLVVFINEVEM